MIENPIENKNNGAITAVLIVGIVILSTLAIWAIDTIPMLFKKQIKKEVEIQLMETEIPQVRVMVGNFHQWNIVKTIDGNVWMINGNRGKFQENDLVQVQFSTNGTKDITDDEILKIKFIKHRK